MECSEARRLLRDGVRPGSTDSRRAALGFHLAGCEACRAYRESGGDQGLLADLLAGEPLPAAPRRPALRPGPPRVRRRRESPWWRYPLVGALALVAISLGLVAGRITRAAYTIGTNIAAMQVTAAPAVVASPTIGLPAAPTTEAAPSASTAPALTAPAPRATPLPAASVIDAPIPLATTEAALPASAPVMPSVAPPPPASPTPIRLPAIGGAPVPTLMATVGVAPMGREAVNILLLGSDRRPGETWQTRSDAIMVVRLDPARQRVALLSFPRDLIVNIPGYGLSRINAATVYGEMYPDLGGGIELARQTVGDLLDIPIHHVVRADFSAFITAVDAIGGVDILVEQELYDPQYPTMDYGYMVAHFLPGEQHMDGQRALIYSRLRHADSDYARTRRQQQVIQAIMRQVRDQNLLGQVQMMADLSTALRDDIQTDLSLDQMLGIAWAFRNFAPDDVERYTLDESMTYVGASIDQYAITAAPGAISIVRAQLLGEE